MASRRSAGVAELQSGSSGTPSRAGVTHIITVAEFGGVAGTAVVLSFVLAVDAAMDALLAKRPDAALAKLDAAVREEATKHWQAAAERGADLHPINYLSMGARFRALRSLHRHLDLGKKEEHELLRKARNDAAHGHLDPYLGLRAIALGEWMLAQLSTLAHNDAEATPTAAA